MVSIKPEFKKSRVAFGNSALPLGSRSQEELIDLALLAHSSQDTSLLRLFEKLPSAEVLKASKMKAKETSIKQANPTTEAAKDNATRKKHKEKREIHQGT